LSGAGRSKSDGSPIGSHTYCMRTDAQELLARAVHELGHAVVAHRLGFKIEAVELDPQLRVVFPSEDMVPASERDLHCMAVVCLAGPVATSRLTGRPLDEVLADVGADDAEKVRVPVDASPEGHRSAFKRDALEGARVMVDQSWSAILRVARVLVERSKLSGDEIAELLKPSEPRGALGRRGGLGGSDGISHRLSEVTGGAEESVHPPGTSGVPRATASHRIEPPFIAWVQGALDYLGPTRSRRADAGWPVRASGGDSRVTPLASLAG
jgi:hypothetical protein